MSKNDIFSSPEYEKAYQKIKNKVIHNRTSVDKPIAIVLGGQPGAGKGRNIYPVARKRFENNIVELDCDKFREYHPESEKLNLDAATYGEKTNPFVFAVVDRLVEELSEQKYNMIIESSMKTPHTAFSNYDLLTPKGYKLEAHIMATPKEVSWQGVVDRYNEQLANGEQARIVPKEFHDFVVENLPNSADSIYKSGKMSNMLVFNRDKEVLYDMSKTPELNPTNILYEQIHGREKIKSFSLKEENKGLCMKETQSDRGKFQMREASPFMKSNCKIKNDIER